MREVNYQAIVKAYYNNLQDNLRSFRGGEGFLEEWAHDEDINRSLIEILYLAYEHDELPIQIILPEDLIEDVDVAKIKKEVSSIGQLSCMGRKMVFK